MSRQAPIEVPASPPYSGGVKGYTQSFTFVTLLGLGLSGLLGGCDPTVKTSAKQPSVVLVVIDTLRADRLGAYGYAGSTSPNIDALAKKSVLFERAISPAPFTIPATSALMTGRYPDRLGTNNHAPSSRLPLNADTLAEAASRAGYETAAVVSNAWLSSPTMQFDQGFETFVTKRSAESLAANLDAQTITDEALAWLDRRDEQAPYFLWVHYLDPHMPYEPTRESREKLGALRDSALIRSFVEDRASRQAVFFDVPKADETSELAAAKRLYDAAVRDVDREIRRLMERVANDDALVVITADHGESLGDHGLRLAHDFTVYEELIHVPLLFHGTGAPARRIENTVSLLDVFPTLCAFMQLECADSEDAIALSMTSEPKSRPVFALNAPFRKRYDQSPWHEIRGLEGRTAMARVGDLKLIRRPRLDGITWEVYDLAGDPGETDNLAKTRPASRERTVLERWLTDMREARAELASLTPMERGRDLEPQTKEDLRSLGYLN